MSEKQFPIGQISEHVVRWGEGGSSAGNSKDGGNGCGVEGDYSILIFILDLPADLINLF